MLAAFDSVWVSTDHDRIAEVALQWGARVHRRSPEVARDQTSSVESLQEFMFHHPGGLREGRMLMMWEDIARTWMSFETKR